MFQFRGFAPRFEVPLLVGCPIRIFADCRSFAPPRDFSQLITSFFALQSLGILRVPLFSFLCSLKLYPFRDTATFFLCQRLASLTKRLFFTTSFLVNSVNMSMNLFAGCPVQLPALRPFAVPVNHPAGVEDKGFEPLTPCLQSRCSSQLS